MMPHRTFPTEQLLDWGVHHHGWEDSDHVVFYEELGMNDFECEAAIVFRAPDDGKLYRLTYEYNNGAGFNDFTGISHDPYKVEEPCFIGTEVEQIRKIVEVTSYVPVPDGEPR